MNNKKNVGSIKLGYLLLVITLGALAYVGIFGYAQYKEAQVEKAVSEYENFLIDYEAKVVEMEKEDALAYYAAANSGKDEDYAKSAELDQKMTDVYLDKDSFQKLKAFKESGYITDPIQKRELNVQYKEFMTSLSDKAKTDRMIELQNGIEQKFNTYRVKDGQKEISDNEVDDILKTSKDSARLRAVWEQSKNIGSLVNEDIVKLVKLRNDYAHDLGFANYQQMSMRLSEQDPQEVERIFDELDAATKDIYAQAKGEIDEALAKNYGINVSDLRPWHYQNRFFQEVPKVLDVDMDAPYKNKDVLSIAENYYSGVGLPIDDIAKRSDLYPRPGKYQHAMTMDIDRKDDIRVIANVENNSYWMNTLLHEFGHAEYFKNIDQDLPWELRGSGIMTNEAVALLFQDMIYSPDWMKENLQLGDQELAKIGSSSTEYHRLSNLVFSRWAQVMYRFEKSMYENPDQDLNQLWWDLVEKYQLVKKPEDRNAPDWASKIHIATSPVYYHNYMLGYLYSAQLKHRINVGILKTDEKYPGYTGKKEVGQFLIDSVFRPGNRYDWQTLIEKSTGEKLNPGYFAEQVEKS